MTRNKYKAASTGVWVAVLLLFCVLVAAPASARDWRVSDFHSTIGVMDDGTMVVTERITLSFIGSCIGIGAQMLGVSRGAWEYATKYAQERKQFGKSISEFQGIQFQIAQMATEIEAARLMVYNAARMKDAGMNFVKEAAMTKLFCSQVAERVTSLAIEIYGGYGFTKDYPVEKYWRDSKIGKIYEGTSNMQLATIAKLVMK